MNRLMRLTVAAGLAVALAACGSDDDAGSGSGAGAGAAENYDITLVQGIANDPFYVSMACGAQEEARKLGVTLNVQGANAWDVNQQTPLVNSVAARRPDALLIAPNDSKAMIPPLRQATEAGIKLVLVDTSLEDTSFAVSAVSSDNKEGGREAARILADLVGKKGSVLLVGGQPGVVTAADRQAGFEEEIKKFPEITFVGNVFAGAGAGAAKNSALVAAQIAAHPDLAGVFALNTDTGEGAANAIRAANAQSRIKVVEFDAGPAQIEQLEKGVVQAVIAQKPAEMGAAAVRQAVAALRGEKTETSVGTGAVSITPENVEDPEVARYVYRSSC